MSRLIDADALEKDGWKMNRIVKVDNNTMEYQTKKPTDFSTIEPEQQWIPVSERLPHGSCSDLVNVSIHDDSGDTPFDYTSCGWITTNGEYWIVDNEINNHVIAWMPLPEPYAERREK